MALAVGGMLNTNTTSTWSLYTRIDLINIFDSLLLFLFLQFFVLIFEPKILWQYFGLEQLIKEPTHYTESSSSAIDLFLTSYSNNVFLTGVGDPFLEHNIRYHCPIFCLLKFKNSAKSTLSRHIWLYDRWVGIQTLWRLWLKDLSIDEMVGAWCFGCLSGPPGFTCWISFAPVFSFIF